jgi:hypothetical protein
VSAPGGADKPGAGAPEIEVVLTMTGVREYSEGFPVELRRDGDSGRLVVRAINEGGHNVTHVDVLDLLNWFRARYPQLLVGGDGDESIYECRSISNSDR